MLDALTPIAERCRIEVDAAHRRTIALVGAGAIVEAGHLPAYRGLGLPVSGLYDRDAGRARELAERFGVPRVYGSLDELLDDPAVEVVDIAVHPEAQPGIALRSLAAGRHVLCQKPFALEPADAARVVEEAAARGLRVAVNQQLRFDEGIAATKAMLDAGWLGEPLALSFEVDISTDFSTWEWLAHRDRLEILFHSIHYLDAARHLLGEPEVVFCAAGRHPAQRSAGETRTISTLLFEGGARAVLHVNHENRAGDVRARFRLDGSEGVARGTLGLLYDYPRGRPDTLEVHSGALPTDGWLPYPVTTRWIPDAFGGPMATLLRAVATGEEPPTSGADNLRTLALVEALYRSIETGAAQRPAQAEVRR